jgi:hypothetical protein
VLLADGLEGRDVDCRECESSDEGREAAAGADIENARWGERDPGFGGQGAPEGDDEKEVDDEELEGYVVASAREVDAAIPSHEQCAEIA